MSSREALLVLAGRGCLGSSRTRLSSREYSGSASSALLALLVFVGMHSGTLESALVLRALAEGTLLLLSPPLEFLHQPQGRYQGEEAPVLDLGGHKGVPLQGQGDLLHLFRRVRRQAQGIHHPQRVRLLFPQGTRSLGLCLLLAFLLYKYSE